MSERWVLTPRPPKKSNRWRVVLVAAAVVVAVVVVAAVVIWSPDSHTVDGSAVAPADSGAIVDAAGLESLLLGPEEIGEIVKLPAMVTVASWMKPDAPEEGGSYTPPDCLGAMYSGMSAVYDDNGYSAIFQTRTAPSTDHGTPAVDQSAAAFDNAADAQTALSDYLAVWRRCADKQFTYTGRAPWTLGSPEQSHEGITVLQNTGEGDREYLNRAIAVRGNVLVEVQIRDMRPSTEVVTIVQRILDRIGD